MIRWLECPVGPATGIDIVEFTLYQTVELARNWVDIVDGVTQGNEFELTIQIVYATIAAVRQIGNLPTPGGSVRNGGDCNISRITLLDGLLHPWAASSRGSNVVFRAELIGGGVDGCQRPMEAIEVLRGASKTLAYYGDTSRLLTWNRDILTSARVIGTLL